MLKKYMEHANYKLTNHVNKSYQPDTLLSHRPSNDAISEYDTVFKIPMNDTKILFLPLEVYCIGITAAMLVFFHVNSRPVFVATLLLSIQDNQFFQPSQTANPVDQGP